MKQRIMDYINYGLDIGLGITAVVLGAVFRFDVRFYFACVLILAVSGIVNLIFIAVKEAMSYEVKRFLPVLYACHVVIGVLCYYLIEYVKGYDRFAWLYWLGLTVGMAVSGAVVYFLEAKAKKGNGQNKGPKFMVNKRP